MSFRALIAKPDLIPVAQKTTMGECFPTGSISATEVMVAAAESEEVTSTCTLRTDFGRNGGNAASSFDLTSMKRISPSSIIRPYTLFPEVTKYGNLTLIGRFLVLLEIVVNDFFSVLTNDG